MTNEQILTERWNNIDEYLNEYLRSYKKINRKTRDKIQDVFNGLNIKYSDINKPISKMQKSRLERYLLELKENNLLKDFFGYKARLLLNKKTITYLEYLEIMLLGLYIEENKEFDEINNLLFYKTSKDSYEKGIEDIPNIEPIPFKLPILYTILNIPILNATAESYLYSLTLTNAEELLKQTLIYMQLDKELNVDNKYYVDIFNKQQNRYISIKKDNEEDSDNSNVKMSGAIVNITENICNLSYLQAGKDAEVKKCRFIAERDKRTTKMCQTLDNQIFLIDDWNTYSRYSDTDKRNVIYKTYGLKVGENLPPINNHFHWCRSTISYQLDNKSQKTYKYNDITKRWISKSLVNRNAKIIIPEKNRIFKYKGEEYVIDGKKVVVDYNSEEYSIAQWLSRKINKKITMIPRINYPFGIKTPDYKIKDMYFDLKTINGSSKQALYHAVRGKELQSKNFIFDISNSELEMIDIYEQINSLYRRNDTQWIEIVIIKKDENIFVYEKQ